VKHKSLKSAFALPILDDKAVDCTINFLTLKETYYFTYLLLTALSSNACSNYDSQSLGTVGHLARPSTECSW